MWDQEVQKLKEMYEKNPIPEIKEALEEATRYEANAEAQVPVYKEIDSRVLFDLGATWQWRNLTFDIDVKNIFNKQYTQSGVSTGLIPQRGRWFLLQLGYKF